MLGNFGVTKSYQGGPSTTSKSSTLKFGPGSSSSSWKDVCIQGRKLGAGCELEFIEPVKNPEGKEYVAILRTEIAENIGRWSNTLVEYVVGDKPFYMHLKACIGRFESFGGLSAL